MLRARTIFPRAISRFAYAILGIGVASPGAAAGWLPEGGNPPSRASAARSELPCNSPAELRQAVLILSPEELERRSLQCKKDAKDWQQVLRQSGGVPFKGDEFQILIEYSISEYFDAGLLSKYRECSTLTIRCRIFVELDFLAPARIVVIPKMPSGQPVAVSLRISDAF
jgi:hypothetical protein